MVVSVDAHGGVFRDGRRGSAEAVAPEAPAGVNDLNHRPVLLEFAPSLAFSEVQPVLDSLLRARCVNLAFLTATPGGARSVTLPVFVDHGCTALLYWFGATCHNEHAAPREHRWIELSAGPGGSLLLQGVREGPASGMISFPRPREDSAPGAPEPKTAAAKATRPEPWTDDRLRAEVNGRLFDEPFPMVSLTVRPTDRVADVVACLAAIERVVHGRVTVDILARD